GKLAPLHIDDEFRLAGRDDDEVRRLDFIFVEVAAPRLHDGHDRRAALAEERVERRLVVVVGFHEGLSDSGSVLALPVAQGFGPSGEEPASRSLSRRRWNSSAVSARLFAIFRRRSAGLLFALWARFRARYMK